MPSGGNFPAHQEHEGAGRDDEARVDVADSGSEVRDAESYGNSVEGSFDRFLVASNESDESDEDDCSSTCTSSPTEPYDAHVEEHTANAAHPSNENMATTKKTKMQKRALMAPVASDPIVRALVALRRYHPALSQIVGPQLDSYMKYRGFGSRDFFKAVDFALSSQGRQIIVVFEDITLPDFEICYIPDGQKLCVRGEASDRLKHGCPVIRYHHPGLLTSAPRAQLQLKKVMLECWKGCRSAE